MSQISNNIPTYKCVIIGNAACGKTSLIESHLTGAFEKNYKPTQRTEESLLTFYTSRGPISFKVWESTGQKMDCYTEVECAIVMYDMSTKVSYDAVPKLTNDLLSISPNIIPVALCANKFDLFGATSHLRHWTDELMISVKLRLNLGSPFLYLAQKLFGDPNLRFVPMMAEKPPYSPIFNVQKLCASLMQLPKPPIEDNDDYYYHIVKK